MLQQDEKHHGRLFLRLREAVGGRYGEAPEAYDAHLVDRVVSVLGRVYAPGAYFDLSVRGFERVPEPPVMLVSNHSGGTTIPDVWGFAIAWYRQFGTKRPLHVMGHELLFATRPSGRFMEQCGVLRATPGVAQEVLHDFRRDLLVLPGGDREVWRTWRDRYKVNFAGRTGYAKLALQERVPIVPVAHAGAHETLVVLTSGEKLAKWLGLQRVARAQIFPVHLSLPWGLAVGPLPHLPVPARFRYVIGEAISPRTPPPYDAKDVAALDDLVRRAVQAQLDLLAAEKR